MTTRPAHSSVSVQLTPDAARRPTRRAVIGGVVVTLLIAAGAYGTARTLGPEPAPQRTNSSPQITREMHNVIVALYGPRAGAHSNPDRDNITRQLRQTTIALYGPRR